MDNPFSLHNARRLSAAEILAAPKALGVSLDELADELGVSSRSLRRWGKTGVAGLASVAIQLFLKRHVAGLAWRDGAVNIGLTEDGVVFLTDEQALANRRERGERR